MTITSLPALQELLFAALRPLEAHKEYALLNYPDHPNIGDHIIWLGALEYLSRIASAQIRYAASAGTFSPQSMPPAVPILMAGGGNLGDLWPAEERFRQSIIQRYPDRPIFILPQTIHFQSESNALAASAVYQAHPDLTLYARDHVSLALAQKWFPQCRLQLAPDMAFALHPFPALPHLPPQRTGTLYHCRVDQEFRDIEMPSIPGLIHEEWASYGPKLDLGRWLSRRKWMTKYPEAFQGHSGQALHRRSWGLLHDGAYQLARYPRVITNRLHGHILALLMGIPHVVLPGAYHKIDSFVAAWTAGLPKSQYCQSGAEIAAALD